MNLFLETLLVILPVFLVIGFGYSLKFTALLDDVFLNQLNKLVYFVALPALLFHKRI